MLDENMVYDALQRTDDTETEVDGLKGRVDDLENRMERLEITMRRVIDYLDQQRQGDAPEEP